MADRPRILVVDDEQTIREALAGALEESGYETLTAAGIGAARLLLASTRVDAVLLDIRLRDGDGLAYLEELRAADLHRPVIMATAYGDSDRTIRAMSLGAFEYVTKPFDFAALLDTLARAVRPPAVARIEAASAETDFVGSSPAMLRVWKAIGRAAASRVTVLVTGESGVGKELVARAIHAHGPLAERPFVAVNLAALSPSLVESELFGHEKGAFTGATARREGRFALAAGGTLFLDEIGDLDGALQTKLLRVLEDGGFERVGGSARLQSDARIIAATSRPVTPGTPGAVLREDLYYRLGVVRIEVPPLRERRQDIALLVDAFLRRMRPRRAISEAAMRRLTAFDWPGNVRQLLHAVENACVMSSDETLDVGCFELPDAPPVGQGEAVSHDLDLRSNLERLERTLIRKALAEAGGNRAQAARLLGIRRALLYDRMKQLDL